MSHCQGDGMLAGIGQQWLGLERATGIEYIALEPPTHLNQEIASANDRYV